MADDFARQLLDALYNPETQPPQQPSRPLREKLAGAAETVGTLGSGLLASVPAGLAGLTQLIPTRGHRPSVNRAAQKVEDVQSALTYLPRTEAGQEYLEKTAGALGVLGMPAEFLGEQTLKLTGSPLLATVANVGLDPVNYIGIPGTGKAAAAATKATGRAIAAAPRVAGEMISDLVMPAPRAQAQRGAIDLGPQIPEFQPQTTLGLISRADEALAALPRNKGTGAEFLRELEKTPGVRMAELEDRGLIEALSGMGKVTKADVLKALQDNPPVKLEEVVLGVKNPTRVEGRSLADASIAEDRKILEDAGIYPDLHPDSPDLLAFLNSADGDMVSAGELRQLVQNPEYPEVTQQVAQAAQNISDYYLGAESSKIGPAKYGRYTLPGGENYRELLLTLPSKRPSIKNMGRREYDEAVRRADEQGIRDYTTPHWDQPNVLAHARISDRTGPNGEKILHVEEVQSDWHQTGRKEGYKTGKEKEQIAALSKQYDELTSRRRQLLKQAEEMPDGGPEFISLINESNAITPKLMRLQEQMDSLRSAGDRGVPDAPFKKNWHELMMRRLVDYAAKNGYDRIAITPGAEQASRYDLSKQVDEINVVGRVNALTGEKTKSVALDMKSGESLRLGVSADGTVDNVNNDSIKNFVGKKLSDVIGKDLSNKILSEDVKTLSGVDLQVGGEGMKGFYDKILPTYLNELGKPYGVKVGQMEIEIPGQEKRVFEQIPGEIWSKSVHKPKTFSTHSFAITPQMREAIKSKGLPLYAKGGSVHISDNPDTMQLELARGGGVGEDRDWRSKIAGGGIRGIITRGLLGMDPPEDMTAREREIYENTTRASAPALGLAAAPAVIVKGAKGAKAAKAAKEAEELKVPYNIPRAPAKTREEIRPIAQRMAEQLTGEFVRPKQEKSVNPAGKSLRQFLQEKEFEKDYITRKTKDVPEPQFADIEKQEGMVKLGISGDTTMADTELLRAGPYPLDIPVPLHGGPRFPLGGEGAWASNNPQAANVQKRVGEISEYFGGAPVLGQYVAMGPAGSNFAQHLADANLRAIDLSRMNKRQIEEFNNRIRGGNKESGPRPSFPGIQDKDEAYLWFAFDPKLRIHFNELMQKTSVTGPLNLPDGRVILDAVTEPQLRNKEIMTSGLSQFHLDPSIRPEDIPLSMHPTYTHLIPMKKDAPVTQTRYPIPAELEFPDVTKFIRENYRPAEFTGTFQKASPRQLIDPQAIAEIKMFEELMKEYTGKKKGGAVKKQAGGAIKAAAKAAERAAKTAKPEVLPAAERDANLAKMLQESKAKTRLYHGTKAHDEYADEPGQAFKQFTSSPTWLAKEPYTASGYSGGTGSIYPVYAQIKKPLVLGFDANDEASKAFAAAKRLGVDVEYIKGMSAPEKAWEVINHPSFIDAVERAGYDGISVKEGGYRTFGVLDPRRIKSATGNRGTFDVTNPDITKKRGGKVSITDNLDTMRLAVQKRK